MCFRVEAPMLSQEQKDHGGLRKDVIARAYSRYLVRGSYPFGIVTTTILQMLRTNLASKTVNSYARKQERNA